MFVWSSQHLNCKHCFNPDYALEKNKNLEQILSGTMSSNADCGLNTDINLQNFLAANIIQAQCALLFLLDLFWINFQLTHSMLSHFEYTALTFP